MSDSTDFMRLAVLLVFVVGILTSWLGGRWDSTKSNEHDRMSGGGW